MSHSYSVKYCGHCRTADEFEEMNFFSFTLIKNAEIWSRYEHFWPPPAYMPSTGLHDSKVDVLREILAQLGKTDDAFRLIMVVLATEW